MKYNDDFNIISSRLASIYDALASIGNSNSSTLASNKDVLEMRSNVISRYIKKFSTLVKHNEILNESYIKVSKLWEDFSKQLNDEVNQNNDRSIKQLLLKNEQISKEFAIFKTLFNSEKAQEKTEIQTTDQQAKTHNKDDTIIALLLQPATQNLVEAGMKKMYGAFFSRYPLLLETSKILINKILAGGYGNLNEALLNSDATVIDQTPFIKLLIITHCIHKNADQDKKFIEELFRDKANEDIASALQEIRKNKDVFTDAFMETYFLDKSGKIELPLIHLFNTLLLPAVIFNKNKKNENKFSNFLNCISFYFSPDIQHIANTLLNIDLNNPEQVQPLLSLLDKTKRKMALEAGIAVVQANNTSEIDNIIADKDDGFLLAMVPFVVHKSFEKALYLVHLIKNAHVRTQAHMLLLDNADESDIDLHLDRQLEYVHKHLVYSVFVVFTKLIPKFCNSEFFESKGISFIAKVFLANPVTAFKKVLDSFSSAISPKKFEGIIPLLAQNSQLQELFTQYYTDHLQKYDPSALDSFIKTNAEKSLFEEFLWANYFMLEKIIRGKIKNLVLLDSNNYYKWFNKLQKEYEQHITYPYFRARIVSKILSPIINLSGLNFEEEMTQAFGHIKEVRELDACKVNPASWPGVYLQLLNKINKDEFPGVYAQALFNLGVTCEQFFDKNEEKNRSQGKVLADVFFAFAKATNKDVYHSVQLFRIIEKFSLENIKLVIDSLKTHAVHADVLEYGLDILLVSIMAQDIEEGDHNLTVLHDSLDDLIQKDDSLEGRVDHVSLDLFIKTEIVEKYKKIISEIKLFREYEFIRKVQEDFDDTSTDFMDILEQLTKEDVEAIQNGTFFQKYIEETKELLAKLPKKLTRLSTILWYENSPYVGTRFLFQPNADGSLSIFIALNPKKDENGEKMVSKSIYKYQISSADSMEGSLLDVKLIATSITDDSLDDQFKELYNIADYYYSDSSSDSSSSDDSSSSSNENVQNSKRKASSDSSSSDSEESASGINEKRRKMDSSSSDSEESVALDSDDSQHGSYSDDMKDDSSQSDD